MSRFFFNVSDQGLGKTHSDKGGTELPDLAAAHIEAMRLMGGLLRDTPARFALLDEWSIDVRNDDDVLLFMIQFSTIVAPAAQVGFQAKHVSH